MRCLEPGQIVRIAILDDYVGRARELADWDGLGPGIAVEAFRDPMTAAEAAVRLAKFDVLSLMRERMVLSKDLLRALPLLKLVVVTGSRFSNVDRAAAEELGIEVRTSGGIESQAPAELALTLLLAALRYLPEEIGSLRAGGWQTKLGWSLQDCTVGVLGLGRVGRQFAGFVRPLAARVIGWSPNFTPERAAAAGVEYAQKDTFFAEADAIVIHMVLSESTRSLVGAAELALMRPGSILVNTSRGPLVDEAALIDTLRNGPLGAAALDVFDTEPLPADHPFRTMPNVLATPHIGYCTHATFRAFYEGTVKRIRDWLEQNGREYQ